MTEETHTPSRRTVLRNGALTGAGLTLGLGATGSVGAATVLTDDPQSAIDDADPGDTVVVEDGTYAGTLTVDVPDLTVRAENYRGSVVKGGDRTDGPAVSIEADGVTFGGFEVTFPGGLLGIKIQSGYDDCTVRGNFVTDVGPVGRLGATGIIGGGPHDGLAVTGNVVQNVTNEINEESGFPTVNGIFVDDEGSGTLTDSTIADNTVRDLRSDVASLGILLGIDGESVEVTDNEVRGLRADPAVDSDDGDDSYDYKKTFAQGLNVSGGTTNVRFARNVVEDVIATFFVGTGLKIDGQADGLTVEFNDLLPTVGIENADATPVTATCNYWGHPKGPREVGTNRGADDGRNRQGRSAVVGPTEFEPWLVRSIRNGENLENSCVGGRGGGNGN
jgi:hypothetical protein